MGAVMDVIWYIWGAIFYIGLTALVIARYFFGFGKGIIEMPRTNKPRGDTQPICLRCHSRRAKEGLNGNPALELLLWCLFIIPGLVYTASRKKNRPWVCQECGSHEVIPADSPRGRALIAEADAPQTMPPRHR